mgnify:CR=1 FL=1
MNMKIKKGDMKHRAASSAGSAPSIADRVRHAQEMSAMHPVDETAHPAAAPEKNKGGKGTDENYQLVSLDLIDEIPLNARAIYRPERIREIAESISASGQDTAGIAIRRNGRFLLVAGGYRFRALKLLADRPMELKILDESTTDQQLYEISFRENDERESGSALDHALVWKRLLESGVYSNESQIAVATKKDLSMVNRIMSALQLSDSVLALVRENPNQFGVTVLSELVLYEKAAGTERAVDAAKRIGEGELSRKDLNTLRTKIEQPKDRKRKENSRQYKIRVDDKEVGFIKEWDSGKLTLDVIIENHEEKVALLNDLKSRFNLKD